MELPTGWAWAALGELGTERRAHVHPEPDTQYELWSVPSFTTGHPELVEGREIGSTKLATHPYDVLICKINPRINRVWMTMKGAPDRVQVASPEWLVLELPESAKDILAPYLRLYLSSPQFRSWIKRAVSGATGSHTRAKANQILKQQVPVPPLAEQHRIVETLEGHLSRIDSTQRDLAAAQKKVTALRKATLLKLVPELTPHSWEVCTVGEAGAIDLGRQRHPDWHHGPEMRPYLRVANVFEDRIDTSDVMEMDFSGVFEKYRLEPGDVLLNEGQSPHLVGRPALYRGNPPNVAFTNSLLRFRVRGDVLPEWALIVFRRHLHARRFMREVRITTNIAHLSAKRLKAVEFPIPPIEEQKQLIQECDQMMSIADAMDRALSRNIARAQHLRASILDRVFTGRLVPQDPTDEPASVLLDRIRAERAAQGGKGKVKRTTRRPRKTAATPAASVPPPPPAASGPAPTHAVQQELPL